MTPKNFVTIYHRLYNVELTKPPGMIPWYISKVSGGAVKTSLVGYNVSGENFTYYERMKDNLSLVLFKSPGRLETQLHFKLTLYLARHARTIDMLHLYHYCWATLFKCLIYRILNPNGCLYVKLDADWRIRGFFEPGKRHGLKKLLGPIRPSHLCRRFINGLANIISVETTALYDYLMSQSDGQLRKKLFLNPYGLPIEEMDDYALRNKKRKEHLVITVGRLGTEQKNTELLMESIARIKDHKDWKYAFIGPYDALFEKYVGEYFLRYPWLKNIVQCPGNISERPALYDFYHRASIFCLTSRFESWAIVLTEAAYFGDYIITTDVGCAREITDNGKLGCIMDDMTPDSLADKLQGIINGSIMITREAAAAAERCKRDFSWAAVVKRLIERSKVLI